MDKNFFASIKTIAIVGLSADENRPSYQVGKYLQSQGFRIIPVNPGYSKWEGEVAYPDLLAIPKEIVVDVVDVFRKSEAVMPVVEAAVGRGDIKTIWLQEGVANKEAEDFARSHGLQVVSNFCLMKAHRAVD